MRLLPALSLLAVVLSGSACSTPAHRPLPRPDAIDVPRFMGTWYVIAHIPSWPERDAYDAIEKYELQADGRIATTFTFRRGGFQEPLKSMHPVGRVEEEGGGAVWGMQFVWPIQAEYVIAWVDDAYGQTIVARSKRDYVWFMARTPEVSDADYRLAVERIAAMGYDVSQLRRVPQSPR